MNDYVVAAYDLRGFGESEIPEVRCPSPLHSKLVARGDVASTLMLTSSA